MELYRRGVRGVVPRSISPDLLIKCVRKIAAGETWIDNQSISWVIEAYRAQATTLTNPRTQPKLSKKELAIIGCITRGMRNKEIAYQIGTTEQVIKNYLRKVYDKLGVSDRLELALYCLHHQMLKKGNPMHETLPVPILRQRASRGEALSAQPLALLQPVSSADQAAAARVYCLLPGLDAGLVRLLPADILPGRRRGTISHQPHDRDGEHLLDAGDAAGGRAAVWVAGGAVRAAADADGEHRLLLGV